MLFRIARFGVVLHRLLLVSGLLLVIGIWFSLRKTPEYLTIIHTAFAGFAFVAGIAVRKGGLSGLLIILASAPMFGNGLLSLCSLLFTLAALTRVSSGNTLSSLAEDTSALWILVLPFILSLIALILVVDWQLLNEILHHGGAPNFFFYLMQQERSKWFREISFVFHILSLIVLFAVVRSTRSSEELRADFTFGLLLAGLVSSALFFVQLLDVHPIFSMNQSSFWVLSGRYSGAFSDPNAHGILAAMLIPILCVEMFGERLAARPYWKALCGIAIIGSSFGALWSGSRTFWIAIVMTFLLIWRKRGRRMLPPFAIVALPIIILLTLIPQTNRLLQAAIPFPGIVRLLKTLELGTIQEMFLSRATYNRLAFYAWMEKPFTGHGLFRFYEEQARIAANLGIALDGWRDNANNFYLQILSESGLIGFLALCLGIVLIRRRLSSVQNQLILNSVLGAFLIVLLTGPHVFFEEVRAFIFLLLAVAISPTADCTAQESKRVSFAKGQNLCLFAVLLCALYFALLIFQIEKQQTRGLYAFEKEQAEYSRWTGLRAQIPVCRNAEYKDIIELKCVETGNPPEVAISLLDAKGETLFRHTTTVQGSDWNVVPLPRHLAEKQVRIEVSKAFLPSQSWGVPDYRTLGVRVRWSRNFCESAPEG